MLSNQKLRNGDIYETSIALVERQLHDLRRASLTTQVPPMYHETSVEDTHYMNIPNDANRCTLTFLYHLTTHLDMLHNMLVLSSRDESLMISKAREGDYSDVGIFISSSGSRYI